MRWRGSWRNRQAAIRYTQHRATPGLRSMRLSSLTLEQQRAVLEVSDAAAPGTSVPVDAGGVSCEWVTAEGAKSSTVIVAVRGGGYCLGSLASNRRFCWLLADFTTARVLNVGNRNAPEHRHPAALHDVQNAYRWLLNTGTDPRRVAFVGNSAGGGLVLAALLALRDAGESLPGAAVAISPWTDLAVTGASITANAATEVLLDPGGVKDTARLYADDERLTDPYVSPLYGRFDWLPPILVQVSSTEILLDDAVRVAERARHGGVEVRLEVVEGMPHVWHFFAGILPEADDALFALALWLDTVLG